MQPYFLLYVENPRTRVKVCMYVREGEKVCLLLLALRLDFVESERPSSLIEYVECYRHDGVNTRIHAFAHTSVRTRVYIPGQAVFGRVLLCVGITCPFARPVSQEVLRW